MAGPLTVMLVEKYKNQVASRILQQRSYLHSYFKIMILSNDNTLITLNNEDWKIVAFYSTIIRRKKTLRELSKGKQYRQI
jgi:hypothetical protein